jgi:hypothetical protein
MFGVKHNMEFTSQPEDGMGSTGMMVDSVTRGAPIFQDILEEFGKFFF